MRSFSPFSRIMSQMVLSKALNLRKNQSWRSFSVLNETECVHCFSCGWCPGTQGPRGTAFVDKQISSFVRQVKETTRSELSRFKHPSCKSTHRTRGSLRSHPAEPQKPDLGLGFVLVSRLLLGVKNSGFKEAFTVHM